MPKTVAIPSHGTRIQNKVSGKRIAALSMNIWSVTAMGIGAMVGAGIFALLGEVALVAGDYTYVSFILGGVVALLSGYSYAKLAARYPDAGGIASYYEEAFGTGRVSGTLTLVYLLTIAATIALIAKAFGAYAAPLAFGNADTFVINAFASGITIILILLNIADAALVGKAEIVLVGIKLTILVVLMLAGTYGMMSHPVITHVAPKTIYIFSSVGMTFLAYAGFGMMTNASGSVSYPKKTIPRAIYLAIGVVIVLYVGLALIVLGSVSGADIARNADTAVAVAARPVLGKAGYAIVSVGALLATASAVNAWVFTAMQISLAMAKVKQLPKMFGQFLWGKGTLGLLLGFAAILVAINVFDLNALARIASATFLICYMAVHAAHWQLVKETRGSRLLIVAGFLSMAIVLALFCWTTALAAPWALGLIAAFIIGSGLIEFILLRANGAAAHPGHSR
jgi:amino acid transporter